MEFLKKLLANENGATAIEYGLIAALIFLAAMTAIVNVGNTTVGMWNHVSNEVQDNS